MDIILNNLWPASGTSPIEGEDTLGHYVGWDVGSSYLTDAIRVPTSYLAGEDLYLLFNEATAGQSVNHKWQITVTLNGTDQEVFTSEVVCPAAADDPEELTIQISTSGAINGTALASGDILSIEWERVAATADEDSNTIRVYTTLLRLTATDEAESGCLGEVGAIIDEVRDLINDANAKHMSTPQIIRAMNAGLRYITKKHYFKKESALNITGGTGSIVVSGQVSDFRKALALRYENGDRSSALIPCPTWEDFQQRVRDNSSAGDPEYWIAVSNTIHFTPVPAASETGTLKLIHSYNPTALACLSSYSTPFPASDYDVLVFWCVWWTHSRFYSDNRVEQMQHWWGMFQTALNDLVEQGYGEMALRPA